MSEEKKIREVVGDSFEEMPLEDMENTQGAGDVDAESTPATPTIPISAMTVSAALSVVSGAAVSAKKC